MMEDILEIAIRIAVIAHRGQTDRAGKPYISHSPRVMNNVPAIEEKIVAILHDVIEDTSITAHDLIKEGIPQYLVNQIKILTHGHETEYSDYIRHISLFPVATSVKLCGLKNKAQ